VGLSEEAWKDAEALRVSGSIRGAISRYYYAAFYAARAALVSRSLEPKTHSGTRTQFMREFVHADLIQRETARALTDLQKEREEADYDRVAGFVPADVEDAMHAAKEFRGAVQSMLRAQGWMA